MINIKNTVSAIIILFFCLVESNALIKDSLFATVGNKAITRSDIVNEIKTILILNGQNFSQDYAQQIESAAIQSTIKRNIKQIEIEKYNYLKFNHADLNNELNQLASNINVNLDTLKNTFIANGINFSDVNNQIRTELLWNSLIFNLYKDRLSININEIDEQLKLIHNKKEMEEYLISEIIIKAVEKDKLKSKIEEIKNKIKIDGFENVAKSLSISTSAIKGGDLGWLNENIISNKIRSAIINAPVGSLSKPIILPEGILIFKIRDKRKVKKNLSLEETKNQLVISEKEKILNMHSLSHYDKLRRSVSIEFTNE